MDHLQNFINDCDRRTVQARRKLSETQDELSCEASGKANIVHDLAEQIGKKLAKAEQMGAEGNVEESLRFMEEVEEIRQKKALAEQEYRSSMPASSYQQQKLRVCEVCSAYLGIHDNDRRLADHFGGKLHLGFITIREHLASLKELVQDKRMKNLLKDYIPDRLEDFEQSEKPRERERNSDEDRYRDRRSRDSNNRDRRRSRSRSRGHSSRKHRSRSRSRDRRRRSRSRSKRSSHRSDSRDHRRRRHSSDDD